MANFIKEIKDPLTGNPRYVVYEANGGTRQFSTKKEAEAYTPNITDPSENVLNDAIAGGSSLFRAASTGLLSLLGNTAKTWIPRLSFLSVWGLPGAYADAGLASVTTAIPATKMITEGPTVQNTTETILGLVPIFSEVPTAVKRTKDAVLWFKELPYNFQGLQDFNNARKAGTLTTNSLQTAGSKATQNLSVNGFTHLEAGPHVKIGIFSPQIGTKEVSLHRFNLSRNGISAENAGTKTVPVFDRDPNKTVYYGYDSDNTVLGFPYKANDGDYYKYPIMEGSNFNPLTVIYHLPLRSQRRAYNFTSLLPKGTYLGDGKNLTYGLSYINLFNSKGLKGIIQLFFSKKQPMYGTNVSSGLVQPYSSDSYSTMLSMARNKPNRAVKYEIRYTGDYMPWFNDNAINTKDLVESLKNLSLNEQLTELNNLIKNWNPEAKSAIIKDGQILIPHFYLIKK